MQDREASFVSNQEEDPFAGTPYRTVRALGEGGMGEVLEVEHVALGKHVVAKLLKPQFLDNPPMLERFRFEAQALSRLTHPNLVEVLDLGRTPAGRPYFTMELLVGRTLADELHARGALPVEEAIWITREVLAGLAAAHARGLVHRDVKLENVFLCDPKADAPNSGSRGRRVKVLDFGVAKASRTGEQLATAPAYATEEGTLMGTPRYIAPEQIHGHPVDARADIYATGVLLYTLVAGRGPFVLSASAVTPSAGPNGQLVAFLRAHLQETPEPPSHWTSQDIPPRLDRAILRALAKRPDERFASADLFAAELGSVLDARAMGDIQPADAEPWASGAVDRRAVPAAPAAGLPSGGPAAERAEAGGRAGDEASAGRGELAGIAAGTGVVFFLLFELLVRLWAGER